MNTKHKTRQWAPTELPRMRRELFHAAEEAADQAVNDPQVAARFQAEEKEFADHVAKTDRAMAKQVRSGARQRLTAAAAGPRRGLRAHQPNSVLLQRQLDHSSKSPDTRSDRLSSATQLVGLCLQPPRG